MSQTVENTKSPIPILYSIASYLKLPYIISERVKLNYTFQNPF